MMPIAPIGTCLPVQLGGSCAVLPVSGLNCTAQSTVACAANSACPGSTPTTPAICRDGACSTVKAGDQCVWPEPLQEAPRGLACNATSASYGCVDTSACPAGTVCNKRYQAAIGQCGALALGSYCLANSTLPAGFTCAASRVGCTDSSVCSPGTVCFTSEAWCGPPLALGSACPRIGAPDGYQCLNGTIACSADSACGLSQSCVGGTCFTPALGSNCTRAVPPAFQCDAGVVKCKLDDVCDGVSVCDPATKACDSGWTVGDLCNATSVMPDSFDCTQGRLSCLKDRACGWGSVCLSFGTGMECSQRLVPGSACTVGMRMPAGVQCVNVPVVVSKGRIQCTKSEFCAAFNGTSSCVDGNCV